MRHHDERNTPPPKTPDKPKACFPILAASFSFLASLHVHLPLDRARHLHTIRQPLNRLAT